MPKKVFKPEERIREFLRFCDELEKHPFIVKHGRGGSFAVSYSSRPKRGQDQVRLNCDEDHLETLLTRLRQFLVEHELFYYKDLRCAAVALFGDSVEFRSFYDKTHAGIHTPFPRRPMRVPKANGADIVEGHSFLELLEAQLYTGRLHSERNLTARPGTAEHSLAESHPYVKKSLTNTLAAAAMAGAQSIFTFRNHILKLANAAGQEGLIPELQALGERLRKARRAKRKPNTRRAQKLR
jgi:hypothetical protein